jgi:plastocyanin
MPHTLRRLLPLLLGSLCLVFVAACGDDNDDSGSGDTGGTTSEAAPPATTESTPTDTSGGGGGGASSIKVGAVEGGATPFAFDPKTLNAKAGKVTFTLDNPSSNAAPHAIEVEGNGIEEESKTIQPGESAELTVDLKPGKYEFYCPVDGHKDAGMEGTLTVS